MKRILMAVIVGAMILVPIVGGDGFGGLLAWFQEQQRAFHDRLATELHAIADPGSLMPGLALVGIGFLYGVLHAAGPGHGKLVVTSYLLAEPGSLRRGLIVVLLSSLLQGAVAVALVLGLYYLLGLARAQTEQAALWFETVSYALVALVGLRLVVRGMHEVLANRHEHHHGHNHNHDHHDHACGCGHAHMPSAQAVDQARSMGALALMILSIGIRPCSGAIILLLFACIIGVAGPGVVAVFAMSLGTAITTGGLAFAAVYSKTWILRHMQASDQALGRVQAALAIGGGALVLLTGLLFAASGMQSALQAGSAQNKGAAVMHLPQRP